MAQDNTVVFSHENDNSVHNHGHTSAQLPPSVSMLKMMTGHFISQAIYVAAKLGIADLLKDDPQTPEELAQATATHAPSLYRLLRALASVGVFSEDDQGRFLLTPLSELLQADVPGSLRANALLIGDTTHWLTWGSLLYSIQTGETAFRHLFGMGLWEYYAKHPEAGAVFNDAATSRSTTQIDAVVDAYNFSGIHTLVDVGGGHGALLAAILNAYPNMRGILFELPHVVQGAEAPLKAAGIAERCVTVGGDMFASVPESGDIYILKDIIHNWDDHQAVAILRTCRAAMSAQAKLLLIERVVAPGNTPDPAKFMDLNMLVAFGGRERAATEFTALLGVAGFSLTRIIPTRCPHSVIECVRR